MCIFRETRIEMETHTFYREHTYTCMYPYICRCICIFRETRRVVDIDTFYRDHMHTYMYPYIYMCMCILRETRIEMEIDTSYHEHTCIHQGTGWWRLIECLKLQVIFRNRATNYRGLLWKMTYKDKASYRSTPPCILTCLPLIECLKFQVIFRKRAKIIGVFYGKW